jgi:LAO/AO transport system kinase
MAIDRNNPQVLFEEIIKGNIVALAQGITMVESKAPSHKRIAYELIRLCLPYSGKSRRIAISGSPGAGKSTFIEGYGLKLIKMGHKTAILAIDPSSQLSKGSIMGDKTRMDELSKSPLAFIRPSPAGETLGGVARSTRESIVLCEAAGFDHIIIETVGVGQSETAAKQMCDCFVLLLIPGSGDDLQGIKKGIVEMADIILVNKADGEQANKAKETAGAYKQALHLLRERNDKWQPKVLTVSSIQNNGMDDAASNINAFFEHTATKLPNIRSSQASYWFTEHLMRSVQDLIFSDSHYANEIHTLKAKVEASELSPFEASEQILYKLIQDLKR